MIRMFLIALVAIALFPALAPLILVAAMVVAFLKGLTGK